MTGNAQKLLAEAKKLLKSAEERQQAADEAKWQAAERMWKANKEEGATQQEIADFLSVSRVTVNRHISVWTARSNSLLQEGVSYTEAFYEFAGGGAERPAKTDERAAVRVLGSVDDKVIEQMVASLPPERVAAVARAAIKTAPTAVASDPQIRHAVDEATPPEERAERTSRALRDPSVAREVVKDNRARSAMARAASEMEEAATQRQRERAPGLVGMSDFYEATGELSRARQALTKSLDAMRKVDLADDQRDSLREDHDRVKLVSEWIDSYLKSGDHSFDRELDALLREES